MTGKDSSSSQPSSWDGEAHHGPHFILTVFPGGKIVLTTPDTINQAMMDNISALFRRWLAEPDPFPLVIGDCLVQMMLVPVTEVTVEQQV